MTEKGSCVLSDPLPQWILAILLTNPEQRIEKIWDLEFLLWRFLSKYRLAVHKANTTMRFPNFWPVFYFLMQS